VKAYAKRLIASGPHAGSNIAAEPLPDFSRWGAIDRQPMRAVRPGGGGDGEEKDEGTDDFDTPDGSYDHLQYNSNGYANRITYQATTGHHHQHWDDPASQSSFTSDLLVNPDGSQEFSDEYLSPGGNYTDVNLNFVDGSYSYFHAENSGAFLRRVYTAGSQDYEEERRYFGSDDQGNYGEIYYDYITNPDGSYDKYDRKPTGDYRHDTYDVVAGKREVVSHSSSPGSGTSDSDNLYYRDGSYDTETDASGPSGSSQQHSVYSKLTGDRTDDVHFDGADGSEYTQHQVQNDDGASSGHSAGHTTADGRDWDQTWDYDVAGDRFQSGHDLFNGVGMDNYDWKQFASGSVDSYTHNTDGSWRHIVFDSGTGETDVTGVDTAGNAYHTHTP